MPLKSDIEKAQKAIDKTLAISAKRLFSNVYKQERELLKILFTGYKNKAGNRVRGLLLKLKTDDNGRLLNSAYNSSVVSQIQRAITAFSARIYKSIADTFSDRLLKMEKATGEYFRISLGSGDKLTNSVEDAVKKARRVLGIVERKEIPKKDLDKYVKAKDGLYVKRDGVIDGLAELSGIQKTNLAQTGQFRRDISLILNRAINDRADFFDLKEQLTDYAVGSDGLGGVMSSHVKRNGFEALNRHARQMSEDVKETFNLEFFIYLGGLRATSRRFCIDRAGKMFHVSEAIEWQGMKWEGKIESGHDIFKDVGGYHCYHRFAYIASSVAKQIDPKKYAKFANAA